MDEEIPLPGGRRKFAAFSNQISPYGETLNIPINSGYTSPFRG
ncbi:MAG: hypothetical protein QMD82_05565 [bacterium]|nr:hypothetical protein [bacterium]